MAGSSAASGTDLEGRPVADRATGHWFAVLLEQITHRH
jgi:hypothetical protein